MITPSHPRSQLRLAGSNSTAAAEIDRLGASHVSYAARGLKVFPLAPRSKVPLFKQVHPDGDPARVACKGACGRDGHGVYDATTDVNRVAAWRSAHPTANIGGAVPAGVFVLDVDPRHEGESSLARLISEHGPLPATLRAASGGPDHGFHLWWRHPGGRLVVPKDLPGLDLRVHGNYLVMPPSVHPSGGRYAWVDVDAPIAFPPVWLVESFRHQLLPAPSVAPRQGGLISSGTDSIIEWFNASHSLADVLCPRGWLQLNGEGTRWKHPTATSDLSATVRDDRLYVYSTNTVFEPTTAGVPHGHDAFDTFAVLEHHGDRRAAAREARHLRRAGRAA